MKLKLSGILDLSTIDYPRKAASVIFLYGCNFRCPFCFNRDLIIGNKYKELEVDDIVKLLLKNKNFVDAVVITGGEPTIQEGLIELCKELKEKGFLVKVDTNGNEPEMIERLIHEKLADFIALDIKGPFESYSRVIGVKSCEDIVKNVKKTLKILNDSGIDYEARSPIVPTINADFFMLKKHAEDVKDAKVFVLEQFDSERDLLDPSLKKVKGLSRDQMFDIAKLFYNAVIKIRTRENGEEIIKS